MLKQPIFYNNLKTLKEISKDTQNNKWMTESSIQAVYFDGVMIDYTNTKLLHLVKKLRSVDALYDNENELFFIEFKNGQLNKADIYKIMQKIYDTILVYGDITSKTLKDIRSKSIFILVINGENNGKIKMVAPYKRKISDSIFEKINYFKNYCFKDIVVYTEEEFKKFLERQNKKD